MRKFSLMDESLFLNQGAARTVQTIYRGPAPETIQGAGGVFSQKKSDTITRSRLAHHGRDTSF